MDFGLDAETRALRREIRRFVDEEMRPVIEDVIGDIEGYHELGPRDPSLTDNVKPRPIDIPDDEKARLRELAREAGYWAMGVPEEYGGGGLNLTQRCVVLEELSKHRMGLYNAGLDAIELVPGLNDPGEPRPLFERATDWQLETYFLPCLEGTASSAFALTEPAAGSDPRGMETYAERTDDGWRINGTKHYISFAGEADFIILFARTGAREDLHDHGITAFLVPVDRPGLTVGEQQQVIRPEQPFEIHLDDLEVTEADVLGEVGAGLQIAKESLSESRIMYAANCLGPIDQSIRLGIDWANEREVGGRPLAERQAIQWKLGEASLAYRAAKFAVYHAAWKYDEGRDVRHESSVAKYMATETLFEVLDEMIQIHGGMGVDADLPLERWLREARVRRIGQGPSEIHMKTIARNLLKGYEDPDPVPLR